MNKTAMTQNATQLSSAIPLQVSKANRRQAVTAMPIKNSTTRTSSLLSRIGFWLSVLLVVGALYYGWSLRHDSPITAEDGVGYYLGIIGGSLMLVLLLYPARKRVWAMRNWGAVKWWFRTHVLFGILGPLMVLYHANFSLGSLNSSVALIITLIVTISGVIGRFIYTTVHTDLYGKRITLSELQHETSELRKRLNFYLKLIPPLHENLLDLERTVLNNPRNITHSAGRLLSITVGTLRQRLIMRRQLRRGIAIIARHKKWDTHQQRNHIKRGRIYLSTYLKLILKTGLLSFYERLFSFWHVLHFPLFIVLVATGIIHVIAVHAY